MLKEAVESDFGKFTDNELYELLSKLKKTMNQYLH